MSQRISYWNNRTQGIYFMVMKFEYQRIFRIIQVTQRSGHNPASENAVHCPRIICFRLSKIWSLKRLLSWNGLAGGSGRLLQMSFWGWWVLEVILGPAELWSSGLLQHLAPPGLVKQQGTERTSSPWGGRGREEEKRFLFHPQQQGVPKLDPTSHTSLSPQCIHTPGLPQSLVAYLPKNKGNLLHLS